MPSEPIHSWSILILYSHLCLNISKCSLHFKFSEHTFVCISYLYSMCYMPGPFHPPWSDNHHNMKFGTKVKPPTFFFPLLNVAPDNVFCFTYQVRMWSSSTKINGAPVSQIDSTFHTAAVENSGCCRQTY